MIDEREGNQCPCGRRLSAGWYLCEHCSKRLEGNLSEVADRYRRLNARSGYEPGRYDKPTGSGKPGTKPPGRIGVMALRDFRSGQVDAAMWKGADGKQHHESENDTPGVLRAVAGWAETIALERGFTTDAWVLQPSGPTIDSQWFGMTDHDEMTGCVDPDLEQRHRHLDAEAARTARHAGHSIGRMIEHACDWIIRQGDWIARWPHGGEFAEQVRKLRNRLRTANGEPNPKPVASCIDRNENDVLCEAPIWLPPAVHDRASYQPVVRCSGPGRHEYTRLELARLAEENHQERTTRKAG